MKRQVLREMIEREMMIEREREEDMKERVKKDRI